MNKLINSLNRLSITNIHDSGTWVNFSCPLAPYSAAHGFKDDRHPSAGATQAEDGTYYWNCFCCGAKGKLVSLVKTLAAHRKVDYSALLEKLDVQKTYSDYDSDIYYEATPIAPIYITEYVYNSVFEELPSRAIDYLSKRGITIDTANALNLKYSSSSRRIIFPYYDDVGIVGYSGRSILDTPKKKILNSEFDKSRVLYGQHLWTNKPTVIVEGLFAFAKAYQVLHLDYDIAAISGTTMSEVQANILIKKSLPVTLFLDGDAAGINGANTIGERLKKELNTFKVQYDNIYDIDLLTDLEIFDKVRNAKVVA